MKERQWTIYALISPVPLADAGEVRYVGFTSSSMITRLRGHRFEATCETHANYHFHKNRWLRTVFAHGFFLPTHVALENGADMALWADAERKWIAHYRAAGARLTNATDGGEGTPGRAHSPETRAKIGAKARISQLGRKHTPETIAQMSASASARWASPEERARMSGVRRNVVLSPEGRAKLVESGLRWGHDPASVEKRAAKRRGTHHSPDTRTKMKESHRKRMKHPTELQRQKDRVRGGKASKLTVAQVREIRARVAGGETQLSVAALFGVHNSTVCNIVKRKLWSDV